MRIMELGVLAALAIAGYWRMPVLLVPLAALLLMARSVFGKIWRLRQRAATPLTEKGTTYLVLGALLWLAVAWISYLVGSFARAALQAV